MQYNIRVQPVLVLFQNHSKMFGPLPISNSIIISENHCILNFGRILSGVEQGRPLPRRRGRPQVGGVRPRLRRAHRPRPRQDHRRPERLPGELTQLFGNQYFLSPKILSPNLTDPNSQPLLTSRPPRAFCRPARSRR